MSGFREWFIKLCLLLPLAICSSAVSYVAWQWKIDYMLHNEQDLELRKRERERLRRQNMTASERAREWAVDKLRGKTKDVD